MKIAVISFSGSCGKTTISGQLLKPRIKDAEIYSIESFNSGLENDGVEAEKIAAKQFVEIISNVTIAENAILDVGASNISEFLKLMTQYKNSHEEIDYFVVPTIKEKKTQIDTINLIETLNGIGIKPKKIIVILNKVDIEEAESVAKDFEMILNLHAMDKSFVIYPNAIVHANEIFDVVKSLGQSVESIVNDDTDYRALIKSTDDKSKKHEYAHRIAYKNLSLSAKENMDFVFKTIFGKAA
jgi:hypothetical protein